MQKFRHFECFFNFYQLAFAESQVGEHQVQAGQQPAGQPECQHGNLVIYKFGSIYVVFLQKMPYFRLINSKVPNMITIYI